MSHLVRSHAAAPGVKNRSDVLCELAEGPFYFQGNPKAAGESCHFRRQIPARPWAHIPEFLTSLRLSSGRQAAVV